MKNRFLDNKQLQDLTQQAIAFKNSQKQVSDVTDVDGYQYVDLVQEGGGVLGIALVGYTFILEKAGIRFYSLAGTSAGSINTLLMAALGKPGEPTSEKIVEIIGNKNFFDFVDGPSGIKRLIQKKIEKRGSVFWNVLGNITSIYTSLKYNLGLNPGNHFEEWLRKNLKEYNIETYGDLLKRRQDIPKLQHRHNPEVKPTVPGLAIIASEITTHSKVEFPKMAELYWNDTENLNPSEFVRASMSIPFFFYPFEVKNIPKAGKNHDEIWNKHVSYNGEIPSRVKFVDGGLLSNFPINTFHVSGVPSRPTFGVRLSTYRESYTQADRIFGFTGAMVSTMRQIHDYDFILKNPDYKELICQIDADAEYNWLNFGMSEERQQALFLLGAQKGMGFLEAFKWENYKKIREKLKVSS